MPVTAEQLRRGRDLADQEAALKAESEDVVFMDMTKRPPPVRLYSMKDGEPLDMAPHIARIAMAKRYADGRYLFTNDPAEAPVYKLGTHKCFLHPESAERQAGLLEAAGVDMFVCHSQHHPSKYAMQEIAKSKHGKQWAALQAYIDEQERLEEKAERRQQLDATLALASKAANSHGGEWLDHVAGERGDAWQQAAADQAVEVAVEKNVRHDCGCGWQNEKNTAQGLATHKRLHCPQRKSAD